MRANAGWVMVMGAGMLIGCGASQPDHEGAQRERELHTLHGSLGAFHDVLAPIFHSDPGSERESRACAAVPSFHERADGVSRDPRAAEPAFKTAAAELAKRVDDLDTACGAHDGVEAKLVALHEAFHHALEASHEGEGPGEHHEGEHGEHEGEGDHEAPGAPAEHGMHAP